MISDYLVYLDIPPIPEELLYPIQDIINAPPKPGSNIPNSYHYFQTRLVSNELSEWCRDLFKTNCYAQYQIVREGVHIHKDFGRNVAFNYVLQQGGTNVSTNIYNEDKNLICSEIIPARRWHRLKTDAFHDVTNMTTDRVAVSVELFDYVWNDPNSCW
jgi:hypothetical protein